MKTECEIVRDLLPLYADGVCSESSRLAVESHLKDCPDCARTLEQLRADELERDLSLEKDQVISRQAFNFRRRSAKAGAVIAAILMAPVVLCLILELVIPQFTPLMFLVVLSSILVAASLIVVPLMAPRDKLFYTFLSFVCSLILLIVTAFFQASVGTRLRLEYLFIAISAVLFGLSVVFLPFLIKARPLRKYMDGRNKVAIVLITDGILFMNMLNMAFAGDNSFFRTLFVFLLCAFGMAMMCIEIFRKHE